MDKKVLEEDKFYLALHGQIRTRKGQDYVIDNMLVECDSLGACVWSDEERASVKAADQLIMTLAHVLTIYHQLLIDSYQKHMLPRAIL